MCVCQAEAKLTMYHILNYSISFQVRPQVILSGDHEVTYQKRKSLHAEDSRVEKKREPVS